MTTKRIDQLPAASAVAPTDLIEILTNVSTTPVSKKAAASLLKGADGAPGATGPAGHAVSGPVEVVPETVTAWQDTVDTDPSAVSPKTYALYRRREGVSTTTAATDQNIDSGSYAFGGKDLRIPPNCTVTVEFAVDMKRPATADGGCAYISGTFVRNGTAAPVPVVTPRAPTPDLTAGIAGTTLSLAVTGSLGAGYGIDLHSSPGAAVTINYGVFRTQRYRLD